VATKRTYAEDMMIDSDTFKLEVTNYAKNLSFDNKKPLLVGVEHCHFYHTLDSSGRKMENCNSVGGHTHKVTVKEDKNGKLIAICGPAEPCFFDDKHTHQVTYLKSDKFKVRTISEDAAKVIAGLTKEP
jgi:hypothetical protein